MKKNLFLLLAVGSLALSATSYADSIGTDNGKKSTHKIAVPDRIVQPQNSRKVIYYITPSPRTGSLIPMVYRRYNNRIDSASNAAVYGQSSIESTGALDVGTALTKLDSSISFGGRR